MRKAENVAAGKMVTLLGSGSSRGWHFTGQVEAIKVPTHEGQEPQLGRQGGSSSPVCRKSKSNHFHGALWSQPTPLLLCLKANCYSTGLCDTWCCSFSQDPSTELRWRAPCAPTSGIAVPCPEEIMLQCISRSPQEGRNSPPIWGGTLCSWRQGSLLQSLCLEEG
jgi:hypothetical protein